MLPSLAWPDAAILTLGLVLGGSVDAADCSQTVEAGTGVGELKVSTRPSGASVFMDGTLVGVTPLTIRDVAAGIHRVKVSRKGYVDRESQIDVPAGGGGDMQIDMVKDLGDETVASGAGEAGEAPRRDGRKVLALLAGGGAATAALVLANTGDGPPVAPVGGEIVGDPPVGVAGLASMLEVIGVTDRDSPNLEYTWTFGDGAGASGRRVSHTYAAPGAYAVSVVASDGVLSTTVTGTHLVTVLTGSWRGRIDALETRVELRQEGPALGGTLTLVGAGSGSSAALRGQVGQAGPGGFAYPVEFSANLPCCGTISFAESLDIRAGLNRLSGTAQGKGVGGQPWILTR